MRLTFDFGYEDYADKKNWLPRLAELQQVFEDLRKLTPAALNDAALLDSLEQLDELMRYYCSSLDFTALEPVMRVQDALLTAGKARTWSGVEEIALQYFGMEFERLNALLYRNADQNRPASQHFSNAAALADRCLKGLAAEDFSSEQKLFLGWSCAELYSEAAICYANLMQNKDVRVYQLKTVETLEWLEPYWQDAAGIQDKAAELYAAYGGQFYQYGDPAAGKTYFLNAIRLLQKLGENSDFWYARSIWVKALYALQAVLVTQDMRPLQECERQTSNLDRKLDDARDLAIIRAALGLLKAQKGLVLQQSEQLDAAVAESQNARRLLQNALDVLRRDMEGRGNYYRLVISGIVGKVSACLIGLLDTLGAQLYYNQQPEEAKETFTQALELLANATSQSDEAAAMIVRAECMQYMMMISADEGETDQASFYGDQALEAAAQVAQATGAPAALNIQVTCCALMAEFSLMIKNKPQAAKYAAQGIVACNTLQRTAPQMPANQLMPTLEKLQKRANRKFF